MHSESAYGRAPVDEIVAQHGDASLSRRRFLEGVGAASVSVLASGVPARVLPVRAAAPRIVVIGAGAAGLTCAYRLMQVGIRCTVFEANVAIGGRLWTLRNFFDDGQMAEHGGEFISTEHIAARNLAHELGLRLVDVNAAQPPGAVETYWLNGQRYTVEQAVHDYHPVYRAIRTALAAAGATTLWNSYTRAGYALDHMSVADWIAGHVPGGLASKLGKLLAVACTIEYGADASAQSALNLIYLLGFEGPNQFNLAGTDERFHIIGGNDQLTSRMAAQLPPDTIHLNAPLAALRQRADGSYVCSFQCGALAVDVVADHVVLALPFTMLRRVDYSRAGFDRLKTVAINRYDLGTNAKLHLQFTHRLWNDLGYDGASYSDMDYENSWEVSRGQRGRSGIVVAFPGGTAGASFSAPAHAPASVAVARDFLAELEPVFPGIAAAWNGRAFLDFWAADPWHRGSYAYYGIGQYTRFAGYEIVRQGNVHFCGEHTSVDFQGFINGAVATGDAVASQIVRDLQVPFSAPK